MQGDKVQARRAAAYTCAYAEHRTIQLMETVAGARNPNLQVLYDCPQELVLLVQLSVENFELRARYERADLSATVE